MLRAERFQLKGGEDIANRIKKIDQVETEVAHLLKMDTVNTWENQGIIYHKGRIYVPPDSNLRGQILQEHHDLPDIGHPGQHRTLELIQ